MKKLGLILLLAVPSWASMSSVKTHTYTETSGAGIAAGTASAGDLLYVSCSGSVWSGFGTTSSPSSTWVCNPIGLYESNAASIQSCYSLSAAGGVTTITPAWTGGGDVGCNTSIVHSSSGGTWATDSNPEISTGSYVDTSAGGRDAVAFIASTITTAGSDDYLYMQYGDEAATQASHITSPANFTEIQWDNGHVDGCAEWLDATAQTALPSGWNVTDRNTSSGLLVNAFTLTAGAAPAAPVPNSVLGSHIGVIP